MVSIIIPNYNYSKFLHGCLRSCTEQTYKDIEIIVVDDCSTDDSPTQLLQYAEADNRIRLLFLPNNSGYSKAKNEGIVKAKGEYVTFLDADDMLTPKSVEWRVRAMMGNKDIDLAHGYCLKCHNDETYDWCLENIDSLERHKTFLHAQGIMVRRDVFKRFGLMFEGLRSKADKEMWYRLGVHQDTPLPKLIKTKFIDKPMAFYRRHPLAMHKMRVENKAYNNEVERIFAKRIKQLQAEGITEQNTRFQ